MTDLNRCARGRRCADRERISTPDGPQHVGHPCDRALCDTCTTHLQSTIRDLADLYVQLANRLQPGRGGVPEIRGAGELKVPIALPVEALMAEIALVLCSWEDVVRDVAGEGEVARRVRPGTQVMSASGYLMGRVSALLALGPTVVVRSPVGGEDPEMDGTAAAVELFGLQHRAERALGFGKVWEALPERCWECNAKTLARELGTNVIRCEACGLTLSLDEHEAFVYRAAHMTGRMTP